jgi:hypothetical protein
MEPLIARDAVLVVIEHGAPWPSRLVTATEPTLAAFLQESNETRRALAARMRRGVAQLENAGAKMARAAYAIHGDGDAEARVTIAREICGALARSKAPACLFAIASTSAAHGHRAMFDVLDALSPNLATCGIRLAVHVEQDHTKRSPRDWLEGWDPRAELRHEPGAPGARRCLPASRCAALPPSAAEH